MSGPGFGLVVLTGFLGSGKTTLLCDLLAEADAGSTAVIVNEAGEIGLDGAVVAEVAGGLAIATLANGCICCRMGSDLADTVEALLAAERPAGARPLDRIVLETSGLSKPGAILRQLAPLARHRMRVSVVSTYDAERGPETSVYAEAAAQWAGADTILVTKADRVDDARLAAAAAEARAVNPLARLLSGRDRAGLVLEAFAPRPSPPGSAVEPSSGPAPEPSGPVPAHPRISVLQVRGSRPVSYADLSAWLDNLAGRLGERLLRLKGTVRVTEAERPLLVQSVGTTFAAPRPFGGRGTAHSLVVIARDVTPREILAVGPDLGFVVADAPAGLTQRRPSPLLAEEVLGSG